MGKKDACMCVDHQPVCEHPDGQTVPGTLDVPLTSWIQTQKELYHTSFKSTVSLLYQMSNKEEMPQQAITWCGLAFLVSNNLTFAMK